MTPELPSAMGQAALFYARQGWPVFPCRERDGEPYVARSGKYKGEEVTPRTKQPYTGAGVKDATTDEAVILGWWRRWPQAMIGVAMGRNGMFALDFDPRHDAETGEIYTLNRMKAETEAQIGGPLPISLAAVTQSGGVHLYLRQPGDGGAAIRNRGVLPAHVDVRGDGGYVIAPPSILYPAEGEPRRYRWLHGRHDADVAESPPALIAILRSPKVRDSGDAAPREPASATLGGGGAGYGANIGAIDPDAAVAEAVHRYALAALDNECRIAAGAGDGARNDTISICALTLGHMVGAGALARAPVIAALTEVARSWPDLPKTIASIESGVDKGATEPRDLTAVKDKARARAERDRARAERNRGRAQGQTDRQAAGRDSGGWPPQAPPPAEEPPPSPRGSSPRPTPATAAGFASFRSEGSRAADQPEGVRERLAAAAAAWLARRIEQMTAHGDTTIDPERVKALVFAAGLRVGAGLLAEAETLSALDAAFGFAPGVNPAAFRDHLHGGAARDFDVGGMLTMMVCAGHPMTDKGNAMRFRDRWAAEFLYTTAKGWLGWDGRRYRVLDQEKDSTPAEVMAAVFETVDMIQEEAWFVAATGHTPPILDPDPDTWKVRDRRARDLHIETGARAHGMDQLIDIKSDRDITFSSLLAKWGRASESAGRLGCIANLAKRWMTIEITKFDTDPMMLNCLNGTLDFIRAADGASARVALRPHRREDRLTKLTACAYDPDAAAPEFDRLVRWAQPKTERRRYLRQWAGYNLTGDMGEQIFHIWWGPTAANGKSTVGNALREAIGDYGDITNVETFLDEGQKRRGDQATPDIVRLPGVRFLTSGEPAKGSKINEALINSVTGGDPMLARDNFRSFFRFSPSFKWTLWCNAKPDIPQGTEGIWRRVKVLLWESHLTADERDRALPDRLKVEYPGILAWAVRGLVDWMDNGFIEPDDVKRQSEAYRDDSDPLASFLRFCTIEDEHSRVQSSHLYELFCAWAKAAGETEWKQKGFSRAMKDRGFDNKQSNGMQWLGLRMVKRVGDFIDADGRVVTIGGEDPRPPGGAGRPARWDDDDDWPP